MLKKIIICLLWLPTLSYAGSENPSHTDDLYINGYIGAVMLKEYGISTDIEVRDGNVYLPQTLTERSDYEQIKDDILAAPGVRSIKIVQDTQLERIASVWVHPSAPLFDPLIADQKWPRFSAGYHYYTESVNYKHAFDGVFGKVFPVVRKGMTSSVFTEVGVLASVFATFDLNSESFDLMNADYMVGIPFSVKWNRLSMITRFYHQSSHLGDEYIKRSPWVERVNLSYETIDSIVSYRLLDWLRVYGGAGFVVRRDPSTYGRWSYQFGTEVYLAPDSLFLPVQVLAVDVKGMEETGYTPYVSAKLGIRPSKNTLLTLDFYNGNSPHGQFYISRVTWVGVSFTIY